MLKRSVSPIFITLFVASFILWYIAKLNYTYTSDYTARVNIDGQRIEVPCVVEGVGANLLNYKFKLGKQLRIPMSELETSYVYDEDSVRMLSIHKRSLQNAISVRMSDIKIVALGDIPLLTEIYDEE